MSEEAVNTYGQMWEDLGLNLRSHCALLDALGPMYGNAFLTQENRPKGMEYFDFVISEIHGLRIKELQDHKAAGGKVVGTFCLYVPEEIIRALGALSIGLCAGVEWGTNEVERYLPRNTCALIKSFIGFKLGKVCPYVESADLIVGETTCDGKKKAYEVFGEMAPVYVMELPQMKRPNDLALWRAEIDRLVEKLEDLTGNRLTAENLARATKEVNDKRRALQRLNAARAASPAPISGLDALLAVQVAFYDDVPRFTQMVNAIADELERRVVSGEGVVPASSPRVLVTGSPMAIPNWKVHDVIEKAGGIVVAEEMCTGSRYYDTLVAEVPGADIDTQIDAIATKYLDINCACFTPNDARIDDVIRLAEETRADGIVHYALQFCAPYQIEAYSVEKAAQAAGIPVLRIDTDYSMEDLGQLKTRVEAFLEMLEPATEVA
ncbi:MAG TPA: double-cubane-cluster-containing anaerobic reductase [Coriobacteriia bacterium]|jgi:benzoyl-CoA reductase/2-hydroxyglutaryl-CoA dehydratase subunit BcrC/BadD/HgdB